MQTLQLRSYGKINICLNVGKIREDGFHELDMVILPIELHDSILIQKLPDYKTNSIITIDDYSMTSPEYSTVSKALSMLQKKYNFSEKFNIFVHKNIPIQGGLGGGSSDAAFTIKGINQMLKLNASRSDLIAICKEIGGDVPLFVDCKPSRCRGMGDIVEPVEIKNDYWVLIVKPKEGCSTKEIYKIGDQMKLDIYEIDKVIEALKEGDDEKLSKYIGNSLEKPAISKVPEIQDIKNILLGYGFKIVQLSGSGSSVFALSTDHKLIKKAYKELEDNHIVFMTKVIK